MAYDRNPTWQNGPGGGTPLNSGKLEHIEDGIEAAAAAADDAIEQIGALELTPGPAGPASTVPGPAGPAGPTGPPGPQGAAGTYGVTDFFRAVSTFTGANANARLTAALAWSASAPNGFVPVVILDEAGAAYSGSGWTLVDYQTVIGPTQGLYRKFNDEITANKAFNIKWSGAGTMFKGGTGTRTNVTIGGFTATCVDGAGQFLSGTFKESTFISMQLRNFLNGFGNPGAFCVVTDCDFVGAWTVNAGLGVQFSLEGSDNKFWDSGTINIGFGSGSAANSGQGKPLMIFKTGKSVIGSIYMTLRNGWVGLYLTGTMTDHIGNTIRSVIVEGQNATATNAADGAVIIIEGGEWHFTGTANLNYGMRSAPTPTNNPYSAIGGSAYVFPDDGTVRNDRGMVQINGGRATFDAIVSDRTAGSTNMVIICLDYTGELDVSRVWHPSPGKSGESYVGKMVILDKRTSTVRTAAPVTYDSTVTYSL